MAQESQQQINYGFISVSQVILCASFGHREGANKQDFEAEEEFSRSCFLGTNMGLLYGSANSHIFWSCISPGVKF